MTLSPAGLATWLARNVSAIAADESAGMCYADIKHAVDAIERTINRPKPPRFCGPCPTIIDEDRCRFKEPHQHPHACGTALLAGYKVINGQHTEDTEVVCPTCKTTHNVELRIRNLLTDVSDWRFTQEELIGRQEAKTPAAYWFGILDLLGERVPVRTFRHARATGRLQACGYRHADGTSGLIRRDNKDQPEYQLADVRSLRNDQGGTGRMTINGSYLVWWLDSFIGSTNFEVCDSQQEAFESAHTNRRPST
jgi:hypothetical protein